MTPADRRQFLTGAGVAAAACCGLAGCSGTPQDTPGTPMGTQTSAGGTTAPPSAGPAGSVPTADIPVGGGKVLTDQHVVVVQPEAGSYKAYTSICPHQGCDVARVENNFIVCDCHGSKFSAASGAVETGPAESPLQPRTITVEGDQVIVQA